MQNVPHVVLKLFVPHVLCAVPTRLKNGFFVFCTVNITSLGIPNYLSPKQRVFFQRGEPLERGSPQLNPFWKYTRYSGDKRFGLSRVAHLGAIDPLYPESAEVGGVEGNAGG